MADRSPRHVVENRIRIGEAVTREQGNLSTAWAGSSYVSDAETDRRPWLDEEDVELVALTVLIDPEPLGPDCVRSVIGEEDRVELVVDADDLQVFETASVLASTSRDED